jgi:hypothetical protein
MSWSSHIFTRLEIEILVDPIAALVYFRGDILGAHVDEFLREPLGMGSGKGETGQLGQTILS